MFSYVFLCTTYIVPCLWCGMLWVVWNRGMPPGIRRALPAGFDGGLYVTSGEPWLCRRGTCI